MRRQSLPLASTHFLLRAQQCLDVPFLFQPLWARGAKSAVAERATTAFRRDFRARRLGMNSSQRTSANSCRGRRRVAIKTRKRSPGSCFYRAPYCEKEGKARVTGAQCSRVGRGKGLLVGPGGGAGDQRAGFGLFFRVKGVACTRVHPLAKARPLGCPSSQLSAFDRSSDVWGTPSRAEETDLSRPSSFGSSTKNS